METQDKTYPDLAVTPNNQAKESCPESGLTRRVLVYNDKPFLAELGMIAAVDSAVTRRPSLTAPDVPWPTLTGLSLSTRQF